MNFKQLVIRNVLRNGRAYASYFLSSLFSVMVFFVFALLYFHPELQQDQIATSGTVSDLAKMGIAASQVVIVIMSFVFLWYTFSIFLKSRKRDFSIYLILGMSEKDLRQMIFFENLVLGLAAIVTGISVSLVFSKLTLLISQNLLALEEGMALYLPTKPIMLTVVIYGCIFLFIAVVTTFRLQTENLADMSKAEDKPLPAPTTKWYLTLGGVVSLGGGYGAVIWFVNRYRHNQPVGTWLIVVCVLLTVLGTYLFFNQNSIRSLSLLKRQPIFFKRTNMLTISNLVYRMKANATMYFMIAIVASVAFVGIGTTMAIGGSDYAVTQKNSFAYVYFATSGTDGHVSDYHLDNVNFIKQTIEASGFEPAVAEVRPLGVDYRSDGDSQWHYVEVIPLAVYNKLAASDKQAQLTVKSDASLLLLARTNSDVNEIKAENRDRQVVEGEINYTLAEHGEPISYRYTTNRFNISYGALGVVSDALYEKILKAKEQDYRSNPDEEYLASPAFIVHYSDWNQGSQADLAIRRRLDQLEETAYQNVEAFYEVNGIGADKEIPAAKEADLDKIMEETFYYSSMYQTWLQTKQANGLILMISVLLGAVFFTFAACILYFRLFGELDRDGAYHRSLHILGVSQAERHKIVTREMLVMYFVPIVIAVVHFVVAMMCLQLLVELPITTYILRIVLSYSLFQVLFFLISRWRYLKHLDFRAETN